MSEVYRSQSNVKPEEVSTVDSIIPGKLCVWLRKDITETVNSDGEIVYDFLEKSFIIDNDEPISKSDLKMYWDHDPVDNSNIKNLGKRVSALEKLVFDKIV